MIKMPIVTTLDKPRPASCNTLTFAGITDESRSNRADNGFADQAHPTKSMTLRGPRAVGERQRLFDESTVVLPWRISERVRELLSVPRRWKVIQCFNQGMLLVSTDDDEALFIGSDESSAGPFNIQIPLAGLRQLQNCGDYAVCDGSGSLFMDRFCLITKGVYCYSTAAPNLDCEQQHFLLAQLSTYLKTCGEQSGFSLFFGDVPVADLHARLRPLYLSLGLGGFAHFLLGRGPGLTPSGDDFLVGMMAVMPQKALANEVLQQTLCGRATGVVSWAFFNAAARRHFSEDICLMLHAAIKQDAALLLRLFDRIKKQGHSSGLDLLAGVHFGLQLRDQTGGRL